MFALEPTAERQPVWFMALVATIGSQLLYLFGLFAF